MTNITRIIKEARDQARLTALDFAQGICEDFIELHGDRSFRDDGAVIGGIGILNGQPITVVGIQKGRTIYRIIYNVILVSLIQKGIGRHFV